MSIFDETNYNLILNSTNCVNPQEEGNIYEFQFASTKRFESAKIALSNISLFNSFFNIEAKFGNNTFSYVWYNAGGAVSPVTITIPDGRYSIADLNAYLQSIMIQNAHYLIDNLGNFVYYLEIIENPVFYSIQFNSYAIPTALPSGWSTPSGWVSFPLTATTPQIVVAGGFAEFLGFTPGTYPSPVQSTNYSKISDTTPRTNRVENIIVRCNIVNNQISSTPDVLYSFNRGNAVFGGLINSSPAEYLYVDVTSGYFDRIRVTLVDQDFRACELNDINVVIQLTIKEKKGESLF